MQPHDTPAIEANGLVKRYGEGCGGTRPPDLHGEAATTYGMLGPNGAGKSTTVKVLSTLVAGGRRERAVAGVDVRSEPDAVRRAIGVVGQRAAVDPDATGRENLGLQGRVYGLGRRPSCAIGSTRCSAASACARRPTAWCAPTPAACSASSTWRWASSTVRGCSSWTSRRPAWIPRRERSSGHEIQRLAEQDGLTILLTTHYLEEADRLADVGGHRRPRSRRRRGHAGRAEGRAAGRRHQRRAVRIAMAPAGRSVRWPGFRACATADVEGRTLRAQAEHGASAVPLLLSALEGAGIAVASVTVSRPSLDDVYLMHTGRSFKQSEESFA